ncbi:hypothetical protein L0F63_004231, partial [Massospora cicadina]
QVGFEYNFFVDVVDELHSLCTGVLYREDIVLVPGDCTHGRLSRYSILANHESDDEIKIKKWKVKDIYIHPDYKPDNPSKANLAIMKLANKNNLLTGIQLDVDNLSAKAGKSAYAIGWGVNHTTYQRNQLQTNLELILSSSSCKAMKPKSFVLNPKFEFCTKSNDVMESGGLLVYANGLHSILLGINSGSGYGSSAYNPTIYVKIHSFVSWIHRTISII